MGQGHGRPARAVTTYLRLHASPAALLTSPQPHIECEADGDEMSYQSQGPSYPRRHDFRQAFSKDVTATGSIATKKFLYAQPYAHAIGRPRHIAKRAAHACLCRGHSQGNLRGNGIDVTRVEG
jgi:hypothetical protein